MFEWMKRIIPHRTSFESLWICIGWVSAYHFAEWTSSSKPILWWGTRDGCSQSIKRLLQQQGSSRRLWNIDGKSNTGKVQGPPQGAIMVSIWYLRQSSSNLFDSDSTYIVYEGKCAVSKVWPSICQWPTQANILLKAESGAPISRMSLASSRDKYPPHSWGMTEGKKVKPLLFSPGEEGSTEGYTGREM